MVRQSLPYNDDSVQRCLTFTTFEVYSVCPIHITDTIDIKVSTDQTFYHGNINSQFPKYSRLYDVYQSGQQDTLYKRRQGYRKLAVSRSGTFFELKIERNGIVIVRGTITASFRARPASQILLKIHFFSSTAIKKSLLARQQIPPQQISSTNFTNLTAI